MLTVQDCQCILKKFLNTDNFELLSHDITYNDSTNASTLCIKYKTENATHEVRFPVRRVLIHPVLQRPDSLRQDVQPHDFSSENIDLVPTYITGSNNLVVLIDQLKYEFALVDYSSNFSADQIKAALETLAKYHAATIIFEETRSAQLQKPYRLIQEHPVLQKNNDTLGNWFHTRLDALSILIDLLPERGTEEIHKQFKEGVKEIALDAANAFNATKPFRGILCSDYIGSDGLLFKNSNGAPVACKLMNSELSCYATPAFDVLQLIYMVTCVKERQQHLHEFLQFYYSSLKEYLKSKNLDIEQVMSTEEEFEVVVHQILPLVKLQTACLKQNQCLSRDLQQKLDCNLPAVTENLSIFVDAFRTDEKYRKIMTDSLLDLKDIVFNPELPREDCFEIIKTKTGTTNYKLLNYELLPIGNVNGFFGDHKRLKIEICLDGQLEIINLFVKFTPKGKAQKSIADDCGSFYKEIFFYRCFVPMIQGFNVTVINDCTVPCYFTRQEDVIVFEDFAIKKYGILNHRQPLTIEKVSAIVKQLAKFHASSIILEEKLSEKTKTKFCLKDHYAKGLQESFFNLLPNHQGAQSVKISFDAIYDQIALFPELEIPLSSEDFRIKIKKACELVYDLVKPSKTFRNAVCHGDLWVSNVLVQEIDGKLADCRLVDFQIMRYCPPAHDLLGFIHLTTNRNFRKQYLDEVIKLYHDELSTILGNHGYNIENIYPYDHFLKSIEYMLPQAVCQTVMYYHICIGDPDLLKDYMATEDGIKQIFLEDRRSFIEDMCNKDPIYRERSKESIEDLRDLCVKYF